MTEIKNKLNEKQNEAVMCTEGPLLILAGAGSGKTSTMTHRIAHLVSDNNVSPYNILAVTFTNKAAGEMRDRVEELLGEHVPMWIMTFHAACLRILRSHADRIGYSRDFVVYDPVDTKSVMKNIIKARNIDPKRFSPANILSKISKAKEMELSAKEWMEQNHSGYMDDALFTAYSDYERILRKNNAMDFDDLLLNTVKLFDRCDDVLYQYQDRFSYIMVDEYQDTNHIQYRFVKMLAEKSRNICVVGDDDQCIYQWRGADISNILDFEKDFPGAKVVKLEQNYRSTANILAAAHSVISNNRQRKQKKLWTNAEDGPKIIYRRADNEKDEATYIAQEIDMLSQDHSFNDFAVLYRVNAQSRNFEEAFSMRDIPYRVIGGIRYYDRKEIKDMVAYMRLVLDPSDDLAAMRIMNEPKRGMGDTTRDKLAKLAEVRKCSIMEVMSDKEVMSSLSAKASKAGGGLAETILKYHDSKDDMMVSDIYNAMLVETGYMEALQATEGIEAQSRLENILEFKSVIFEYEEKQEEVSLSGFLESIALLSDIDNHDPGENAVVLMTMHSAKGLEFPVVFMPGMEDNLFPSWGARDDMSKMEEERRLCYVGMTRAKEKLYLTSAEYRFMYGRGDYTIESKFLSEVDQDLIEGDARQYSKKHPEDGMPCEASADIRRIVRDTYREQKSMVQSAFSKGDTVSHKKFGKGLVIEADDRIVKVAFDSVGIKKLAAGVAPLVKLGKGSDE